MGRTKIMINEVYSVYNEQSGTSIPATSPSVVRLAEQLIAQYGGTKFLVEIAPGRDGGLSFIWDDEKGNYIFLDVGPNDTVHLYCEVIGEARWEGVSVADDQRILSRLQHAFEIAEIA
jgi:hypothetical protein